MDRGWLPTRGIGPVAGILSGPDVEGKPWLVRRGVMCERDKVGVGEPSNRATHEGISARTPSISKFLQRLSQIVDSLLGDTRNLLIAG